MITFSSKYVINVLQVASPPPASSTPVNLEQQLKATAVLNAMADSIQYRYPETINTVVQRVPDTEPSPNTRRHRDLAQALFGDDIEKEREQTPKPVQLQIVEYLPTDEHTGPPTTDTTNKLKKEDTESSALPSELESKVTEEAPEPDLVREVQQKAEAAMLALRKAPQTPEQRLERSAQGSISRRRISPSQISEPRLVSASTSVDTIPVRSPARSSPGTSKIGSRFRKLRGTLRAKNPPPIGDDPSEADSPRPSQDIAYDASKLKSTSGPASATENGRTKASVTSPPASAGPGLKGFMARFRSKKGADNASPDRREAPRMSPSVISLAASQVERSTVSYVARNDSAVPSSSSSLQQTLDHPPVTPSHRENVDPNKAALRQLFEAASDLGLDQGALNALLARAPSLSKAQDKPARAPTVEVSESDNEATLQDEPIPTEAPEDEPVPPQSLPNSDFLPHLERGDVNGISTRKSGDTRRPLDRLVNNTNIVVRRTIIYPSEFRNTPSPMDVNSLVKKNSRRRRGSVASASSRSIQDRVPTPPPPKSPTSKSFSNSPSPPVPQIPRSLLSSPEPKMPHSPTQHSFEKSNSAYDSL